MTNDHIAALEAALQAGPTDGPWQVFKLTFADGGTRTFVQTSPESESSGIVCRVTPSNDGMPGLRWADEDMSEDCLRHVAADSAFIAAANPVAIESVLAEVKRLSECLTKANAQAERFEREWYLRGDEVESLREELAGEQARADMHADLGRRTAEALGLTPEEGRAHMPEVARTLKQQNEALLKDIDYYRRVMIQAGEQQDALRAENAALKLVAVRGIHHRSRCSYNTDEATCDCGTLQEVIKAAQAAKERT
jgi:hypothetical protein